jgi:hypothetical protein
MKTRVGIIACMISFAFLLAVPSALAQADKLIGVWKFTGFQSPVPAITTTNPQPSITIFTNKYFGIMMVSGEKPRPEVLKDSTVLTFLVPYARGFCLLIQVLGSLRRNS